MGLANATGRTAIGAQELNRVAAMKYDTIPQMANGCDTVQLNASAGPTLKYRRCLSYVQGTRSRTVTIVVTPLRTGTWSETIVLTRTGGTISNPLNTP
jgi:hypothetical protein